LLCAVPVSEQCRIRFDTEPLPSFNYFQRMDGNQPTFSLQLPTPQTCGKSVESFSRETVFSETDPTVGWH